MNYQQLLFSNAATLLTAAVLSMGVSANVLRVPQDYTTIQNAIDAAVDGDTVFVAPGHYIENVNIFMKQVEVKSEGGPEVTTIDGNNNWASVVIFDHIEGPNSALIGFTITNGWNSWGAGVQALFASPTITDNIFVNNNQSGGGAGAGIMVNGASPTIERNMFKNNSCDTQYLSGVLSVFNSSSPRIANNIFESNPCRALNFNLPAGTGPVITNNTIVDNDVGIRIDLREESESVIFANNVIVRNGVGLTVDSYSVNYPPTWTHNLVFDNLVDYEMIADQTGINGNISTDPLFVDELNNDYRLSANSPAIDAGVNAVAVPSTTDIDGNKRIVDGDGDGVAFVDIGAYEAQPAILFVGIDILPKSEVNAINLNNKGRIQVSILSTSEFSANNEVNPDSVEFGPAGASASRYKIKDVDRNGLLDMLLYFKIEETGIECGDTEATLVGETYDGRVFEGSDPILTIGCG